MHSPFRKRGVILAGLLALALAAALPMLAVGQAGTRGQAQGIPALRAAASAP